MRCIVMLSCLTLSLIGLAAWGLGRTENARREPVETALVDTVMARPSVYGMAWAPDGSKLVAMYDSRFGSSANLVLYDFTGQSPQAFSLPVRAASALDWNADGLLAGGHLGEFWADTLRDDSLRHQFREKLRLRQIASAANGRTAIATEDDCLWLGTATAPCETRVNLSFGISMLEMSKDGQFLLVSGGAHRVLLLEARTGHILREWSHGRHSLAAFAARSVSEGPSDESDATPAVVLVSRDGCLTVADPLTGAVLQTRELHPTDGVASLAVSPDGRTIALGTYHESIGLWDLWSGQPLATLKDGHVKCVYCVKFSPNGQHLASGGTDGQVCVWHVARGVLAQSLNPD